MIIHHLESIIEGSKEIYKLNEFQFNAQYTETNSPYLYNNTISSDYLTLLVYLFENMNYKPTSFQVLVYLRHFEILHKKVQVNYYCI